MKFTAPVSWLRDYLKTDVAAKTIADYLTGSGPSVEKIEKLGEDLIFDVEVTTNRPDAFSIFGLAREAHAILLSNSQKSQLVPPKGLQTNLKPDTSYQLPLEVIIRDKNLCGRFTAVVIDNLKIKPSPAVIKNRLEKSGIRAINNIVDISNYIMLELGQPMHTFDYDKIKGAKMILRQSTEGEKIKTLDGKTHKLPKGTIVIEDGQRLIDLCGIMGGENSQVTSRTKRVLMFTQSYNAITIRKTTQALAVRTEAAARFEKGIDTEGTIAALARSIYLAKQTAGAKIASELIDIYPKKELPKPITLKIEKLNNYLGITIPPQKIASILGNLGFKTTATVQTVTATPPSWRTADCRIEEDLIEEIARVYGYGNLPSKLPEGQIPQTEDSILTTVIELKKALKFLGLTEIISYSIISKDFLKLTDTPEKDAVELANPLTEEWQFMRPSLLVSLAGIIGQNQNIKSDMKLFEIAKTYVKQSNNIPKQDLKIALVLQKAGFFEMKGLVENLFEIFGRNVEFRIMKNNPLYSHLTTNAQIKVENEVVGNFGLLSEDIGSYFDFKSPAVAAEINLSEVYRLPAKAKTYHPIPKYPPVIEDISAIFDQKVEIAQIINEVKRAGEPLVKKIDVLDIFTGEKIGKSKKSVTLRLTYQKPDETPSQEEVTRFREIITREIERVLGAQVRK